MRNLIVLGVVGLFAQLIDGSLGMAYGVTSSTLLLTVGIAPAAASAAVHLSEVGTTLVSGIAHHRLGNVDWRTVSIIAVPGGIGAFGGATFLASLPGDVAKPWVALILLSLGVYVLYRFLTLRGRTPKTRGRLSPAFLVPLGLVGGTMDAIGGGGWGPVGTTSLLSSGRLEPRKVVGSIDTSEFVVAVAASLGFIFALGSQDMNWGWVGALMAGGVIAAPIAAWLVKHMPAPVLGVAAGGLIVITNVKTVLESWLGLAETSTVLWGTIGGLAVAWVALIALTVRNHLREKRNVEEEAALLEQPPITA